MKHFARDITRKITQNPELATTPFTRSNSNNNHHHQANAPLPTSETTLLLVAIEEATASQVFIPLIDALLECSVNFLETFNLPHANGHDHVQDCYFNTLIKLTTVDRLPTDASVRVLIHVMNYAMESESSFKDAKPLVGTSTAIPPYLKPLVVEFLSGVNHKKHTIMEQIVRHLRQPDGNDKTILDKVVEKYTANVNLTPQEEVTRHTLQMHLLQSKIPLNNQPLLHSPQLQQRAIGPICKRIIVSMLGGICPIVLISYMNKFMPNRVKLQPSDALKCCGFINTIYLFTLTSITASPFSNHQYFLAKNLLKEHCIAWINGITDIWGRKKEKKESYLDEIGLE